MTNDIDPKVLREARQYLEARREEFGDEEAWRYIPTVVSWGLSLSELTDAELAWYVGEQERIVDHIASWPGEAYRVHLPDRLAEEQAKLDAARVEVERRSNTHT